MDVSVDTTQEDQEAHITSYEEALAKIRDATGVSDIQEVVDRFLNQGDTRKHLEQLKEENSHQLARLQEEKEKLQAQFEDMKYSGEAKMSSYVGLTPSGPDCVSNSPPSLPSGVRECWRSSRDT